MSPLAIQGIGVLGGFGCGLDALRRSLAEGPAAPGQLAVAAGAQELQLPAYLADPAPLERFVNKRATRRIDHFSKMALLGAHLALEDAGALEASRERMGVVIASGYGATRTTFSFLDSVLEDGDAFASPTHFSNSVHNAAAAHVAIQLKATGPSLTVSQFEMSVASALLTARRWLAEERVDSVLFGAVDEVCAVLGHCWERFFPEPSRRIEPFAFARQSAVPGEGAAFFLLTGDEQGRHGRITSVRQGRVAALSQAAGPWLLNADGHSSCSGYYRQLLPGPAAVTAATPHYGSLPVGQAFDLAVAALALGGAGLPAPAGGETLPEPWQPAGGVLEADALGCLKCDGRGNFGAVTLARG
ncbi:hypothetical protein DESUT3_02700 [Desulfuromonas versatilis]|uniref:Beta-ketoacyl synthase-like N-terminal domain-containing protein n=1 Tax=Desulfuromonas versatilis TaxID=2802975 RepID=A0ABN6DT58_9BACT|nr:beta-ketoacyl synthase N-terminal-like domain-containing protein [Desulfuromonas versatilis]BCR03201.1 hypothetical protein DESUT3_02700 [Desulfuromonas versatilis]